MKFSEKENALLVEARKDASELPHPTTMLSFAERVPKALEEIFSRNLWALDFGISFLDKCFTSISRSDLILIGAPSGAGKSELVTHIATSNAEKGKRVCFFALEAEKTEIETRIIYKKAADLYFKDHNRPKLNMSYENFYWNKLGEKFFPYVEESRKHCVKDLATLSTVYRGSENFDVKTLEDNINFIKHETDLIIIDHLHYFDIEGKNENYEVTQIVKKIRDLSLLNGVPIILVAQFKKSDRKKEFIIPSLDDFHGTSNTVKMCTKAIIIAPDLEPQNFSVKKFGSYMQAAKYRVNGSKMRYVAKVSFDIETNRYDDSFVLGVLKKGGTEFYPLDKHDYPDWATGRLMIDMPGVV